MATRSPSLEHYSFLWPLLNIGNRVSLKKAISSSSGVDQDFLQFLSRYLGKGYENLNFWSCWRSRSSSILTCLKTPKVLNQQLQAWEMRSTRLYWISRKWNPARWCGLHIFQLCCPFDIVTQKRCLLCFRWTCIYTKHYGWRDYGCRRVRIIWWRHWRMVVTWWNYCLFYRSIDFSIHVAKGFDLIYSQNGSCTKLSWCLWTYSLRSELICGSSVPLCQAWWKDMRFGFSVHY